MQQLLRAQKSGEIFRNQTSKWIIYRSFRTNAAFKYLTLANLGQSTLQNQAKIAQKFESIYEKRIDPVLLDDLDNLKPQIVPRAREIKISI